MFSCKKRAPNGYNLVPESFAFLQSWAPSGYELVPRDDDDDDHHADDHGDDDDDHHHHHDHDDDDGAAAADDDDGMGWDGMGCFSQNNLKIILKLFLIYF